MAMYIKKTSRTTKVKRSLFKPLAVMFIALIGLTGAVSSSALVQHEQASADIVNDIVCEGHTKIPWLQWAGPDGEAPLFGEDSITYTIYRMTHTDDLHFAFESKSTVNAGIQDVDSTLNLFINWGKSESFTKINERILGVDLTSAEPIEGATPNGGAKVTAYDRFGLAGLSWTRYNGEWRYPYISICGDSSPGDLKLGVLYEDRLEPLTTYDGIQDTKDVRTAQFANGMLANLGEGFLNTTANWTFTITKAIVAVAIALVNLSFADFPKLLGLNELIGSDEGIFANLYQGIYQPFIGIVMVLVGLLMLHKGIVKREFRGALNLLFRSVALFLISVMMFALPMLFMTLPNSAAVVLQSLVINSMSTSFASGSGICTLNGVGSEQVEVNPEAPGDVTDAKNAQELLTLASENMRSVVGCQLWSTFLVKPWSLGQFGADYNKLYSEGHIPSGAYGATGEVKTDNDTMVGDAAVPVGGGQFIYNWALFQISTGTNAHVPLVSDPETTPEETAPALSPYTNGIANDWYRIVDAMANYNEKETELQDDVAPSNDAGNPIDAIRFAEPDLDKKPTEFWSTWTGGNSIQRIGIALTSVLAACAGLLTVVIFGFLSAIYSFGLIIVMAFAPLFFLAGSLGNQGWETFKSWGQLVLNLVVKRVMIGLILVLNLVILTTILNLMADQDYFWGVAAMALVSFLLYKFKEKIVDTVGGLFTFSFADQNIGSKATHVAGVLKGNVRSASQGASNVAVAGLASGIAAKRNGATFRTGLGSGLLKELKTQGYRQNNSVIQRTLQVSESLGKGLDNREICPYCGQTLISELGPEGGLVRDDGNGNKYHVGCADEKFGGSDFVPNTWLFQHITFTNEGVSRPKPAPIRRVKSHVDKIEKEEIKVALEMRDNTSERAGTIIGKALNKDISSAETIPEVPEFLRYLLKDHTQFIDAAIRSDDPRQLEAALFIYAQAIVQYAYENTEASEGYYSSSPSFQGDTASDIEAIYADLMAEFK
jgi:hypothetical protein